MSNSLEETKRIMKKFHIKANKRLGQNFLVSDEVVQGIISSAELSKKDCVIEIGPGLGILTKHLCEKCGKVICIELDKKMVEVLQARFNNIDNIELINENVLEVDLGKIIKMVKEQNHNIENVKVVANLPYYITTPIIMKLLESNLDIDTITVMIQKEVAERLIAEPSQKQAGAITYTTYYYCTSDKIMEVPKESFIPAPEVTSEVIKLKIREKPPVKVSDKKVMFELIKTGFMQRRKTLVNALVNARVYKNKEEAVKTLKRIGLGENIRAEQLTLQDFANLTNEFMENLKKTF